MKIVVSDRVTYILISRIETPGKVRLSDNVELKTADCSHIDLQTAIGACSHPDDIPVLTAFIPRTTAQLEISAKTPKELAIIAWNTSWYVILLSALLHTEIGFNLQSDTPADKIGRESTLRATNHHMRGLTKSPPHLLTDDEAQWLTANFGNARKLLDNEQFKTATHSLATYRWHTMPRVQMAILWVGIEGMFGASSEIRFRISLYIARFLYPDSADERQKVFDAVKKLYNTRSAAVHGSKMKGDINTAVEESATILCSLLKQCTISNSMPDENKLVP